MIVISIAFVFSTSLIYTVWAFPWVSSVLVYWPRGLCHMFFQNFIHFIYTILLDHLINH